ncbi:MAG: RagB/SusD family nutrient uptake outer membrane protein [Bacteroidales bacterium]|nr:RagB/SusD family nutrient uptake outer membrane protein [Bacteroidales bacterium]
MRKILSIWIVSLLFLTSCESYLDSETYNKIDSGLAFKTVDDIKAARNGLYNQLGSYRFCGKNTIAVGDFAADIAVADGSSGHYVAINNYNFVEETGELKEMWEYGYKMINTITKMIPAIDVLLNDNNTTDEEKKELKLYKAEAHGLQALTYFYLVNIYGLPYGSDSNPHGGVVLMEDKAILPGEDVSRSSVNETYTAIRSNIESSLALFSDLAGANEQNGYYLNEAGVNALKARVMLYTGDYTKAVEAARIALTLKGEKEMDEKAYLAIWESLALSDEEIFSIVKSEDDNLSSNSLNTLYGAYGGYLYSAFIDDFALTDYRLKLINTNNFHPSKFDGIESSAATSNIPIFRVSEMKLIIAESSAKLNQIDEAKEALFFTAKRNTAIISINDLPGDKESLLEFIAKERKRELFQEGHRWYDTRRTGELISVSNGKYTNFDVRKFVYPIPADEINSGYKCEQNDDWHENLPDS